MLQPRFQDTDAAHRWTRGGWNEVCECVLGGGGLRAVTTCADDRTVSVPRVAAALGDASDDSRGNHDGRGAVARAGIPHGMRREVALRLRRRRGRSESRPHRGPGGSWIRQFLRSTRFARSVTLLLHPRPPRRAAGDAADRRESRRGALDRQPGAVLASRTDRGRLQARRSDGALHVGGDRRAAIAERKQSASLLVFRDDRSACTVAAR